MNRKESDLKNELTSIKERNLMLETEKQKLEEEHKNYISIHEGLINSKSK